METASPDRPMVARSAGRTTTRNKPGVELAGEPLSVTRRVSVLVPASVSVGVQVKAPLAGSIDAPGGPPGSIAKLMICAGRSESVGGGEKPTKTPPLKGPTCCDTNLV